MAALPSFVELMSSLGLPADATGSISPAMRPSSPSRSSSANSSPLVQAISKPRTEKENTPAIVVSHSPATEKGEGRRRASSGNTKPSRYSPYAPATRRGSSSPAFDPKNDSESGKTSSTGRSSISRDASSGLTITERRALRRLHVAATPISSFARRHSPHASPTSPAFATQRPRAPSAGLPSPVMLPTLPPISLTTLAFAGMASEKHTKRASERSRSPVHRAMAVDSDKEAFVKQNPAGLRISSLHRHVAPIA